MARTVGVAILNPILVSFRDGPACEMFFMYLNIFVWYWRPVLICAMSAASNPSTISACEQGFSVKKAPEGDARSSDPD